ncbi:MAG: hypothetical protein J2P15_06600 [Micromonosporaceae bacterium]|nr:hypothetical protein [Micromonosporaceae bacterium]
MAETEIARCLQRAGRWDLALTALPAGDGAAAARAQILVDRQFWRLDPPEEALEAVDALDGTPLAALLRGQVRYWRLMVPRFEQPDAPPPVPEGEAAAVSEDFARAADDPGLAGWAAFWHGLLDENLHDRPERAADGYAQAAASARRRGDRLLTSYAVRHQGFQHIAAGRREEGIGSLRRSLHLRASLGAVPATAAAQLALADQLPPGDERSALREAVGATAREIGLTWVQRALAAGE